MGVSRIQSTGPYGNPVLSQTRRPSKKIMGLLTMAWSLTETYRRNGGDHQLGG